MCLTFSGGRFWGQGGAMALPNFENFNYIYIGDLLKILIVIVCFLFIL